MNTLNTVSLHQLDEDFRCYAPNEREARFVYAEIFRGRDYLDFGTTVPPDAFVVDVGANIGLFSLFVKRESPGATVLAFEPMPLALDALRRNLELHDVQGVSVRGTALGAKREEGVTFTYYPRVPANSTRYPEEKLLQRDVIADMSDPAWAQQVFIGDEIQVDVDRLSTFLAEYPGRTVDLLKVDVEGAELDVLRGIDDADWARITQVVMEVQDHDGRLGQIRELLDLHGFAVSVGVPQLVPPAMKTFLVYAKR